MSAGPSHPPGLPTEPRFEILPFGKGQEQAKELPEPVRITVTSSPKHGADTTVGVAVGLRELGHGVTVHLAAREVQGPEHLDEVLETAAAAGIDDLFCVAGDTPEPKGPYEGALEMLELIAGHPKRPGRIGVPGYPEGHPLISDEDLWTALERKSRFADYMATQMCFDTKAFLSWLDEVRSRGITLPAYVGTPGPIDRRRLLDISMRIGVGPSLRYMRKQNGLIRRLLTSPEHAAAKLYDEIVPHVGKGPRGIAGFHFFTYNPLLATWRWDGERRPNAPEPAVAAPA
jgi:methylenetetrahydrofolate reductase (NADPH)